MLGCVNPLFSEELRGTRGTALSGALRGAISLNEGIYYNPASFAFAGKYSIEVLSSFLPPHGQEEGGWIYGGSIVDAHSPFFSAGIGYYHKLKEREGGDAIENAYHLSVSRIFSEFLSLGVTGKYISQGLLMGENTFFDLDAGSFLILSPDIQIGGVGHNLFANHVDFVRELGLGMRLKAWKFLYVNVDLLKNLDTPFTQNISLHAGFETIHENGLVFQGGISLSDQSLYNLYSFGLGWSQHKVGFSYAFQNSMDGLSRQTHALSLRVFF